MPEIFPFLPFPIPAASKPLTRFLPLFPDGLVTAWLTGNLPPGSLLLDPFGSQPRLVIEAASQGYRILVTCNNPIERFLLELAARPPSRDELQAALADLSVSLKGDERTEAHIRSLYMTDCASCGEKIEAHAFIWEQEADRIHEKQYACPHCGDSGSYPASQFDLEHASQFKRGGLNWFRAIERVTPKDDPDRLHAEEALETYTPRAVYGLVSLVNKLDRFPVTRQRDLRALLLAVFEQANSLWSYSTQRDRPRQLKPSPMFIEKNIWLALEESIDQLSRSQPGYRELALTQFPEPPPGSGGICLYPGPLRLLAEQWTTELSSRFPVQGVLAAIPRPNQAYWTLSALWAGWLWGKEATAPFKSVLRRRRYDWQWHCSALHSVFASINRLLQAQIPSWGNLGEWEHGFLAATLAAAELAGFQLAGLGLREQAGQAQVRWSVGGQPVESSSRTQPDQPAKLQAASLEAAIEYLETRQEPATFGQLSAAVLAGVLREPGRLPVSSASPIDRLAALQAAVAQVLADRSAFERLGASERSTETGLWGLAAGRRQVSTRELPSQSSLADRVEMSVVRHLLKNPGSSLDQVDLAACRAFDGLFTPGQNLVRAIVHSYAQQGAAEQDSWQLREQDEPGARRSDLEKMSNQVKKIGEYLALQVEISQPGSSQEFAQPPLEWRDQEGKLVYTFFFLASAICSQLVQAQPAQSGQDLSSLVESRRRNVIVLPGSRSGLLLFKMEENPQLERSILAGWQILKYRLVHRLADNLSFELPQLEKLFELDPLAYRDPQIPLI